jgi:hypothetical protein
MRWTWVPLIKRVKVTGTGKRVSISKGGSASIAGRGSQLEPGTARWTGPMVSGTGSGTSPRSDGRGPVWIRGDGVVDYTVGRAWMDWDTLDMELGSDGVLRPVDDGYNEENGCDPMGRED